MELKYAAMPVLEATGERPTAALRWYPDAVTGEPVLQQEWKITTYQSGVAIRQTSEWRAIPEVL